MAFCSQRVGLLDARAAGAEAGAVGPLPRGMPSALNQAPPTITAAAWVVMVCLVRVSDSYM